MSIFLSVTDSLRSDASCLFRRSCAAELIGPMLTALSPFLKLDCINPRCGWPHNIRIEGLSVMPYE